MHSNSNIELFRQASVHTDRRSAARLRCHGCSHKRFRDAIETQSLYDDLPRHPAKGFTRSPKLQFNRLLWAMFFAQLPRHKNCIGCDCARHESELGVIDLDQLPQSDLEYFLNYLEELF